MTMKSVVQIHRANDPHWVGDGFPVNTLVSYDRQGIGISPFLLLDYAGPAEFAPARRMRGVGKHPHRGFETVTIVYQGEVQHRDSEGNSGVIGPGDVQWMTAARGVVHEEMHSERFTRNGGMLEMIQLWVNLPAKYKMTDPRYQEIHAHDISVVELPNEVGSMRLIAGDYQQSKGAAATFTPINLWDMKLNTGQTFTLDLLESHNTSLLVLSGAVRVNNSEWVRSKELVQLSPEGDELSIETQSSSRVLLMSGEPIEEPIAGYGPFVMNTHAEIQQAAADFRAGRF